MAHRSENSSPLKVETIVVQSKINLIEHVKGFTDVCLIVLPEHTPQHRSEPLVGLGDLIGQIDQDLGDSATLITLGETIDLVHIQAHTKSLTYQSWISIKREVARSDDTRTRLLEYHVGALIHTKYPGALKHTPTRIEYTYCPACNRTTKDYGGKKHTYNSYGTLMSDIWRDIVCDLQDNIASVVTRFADVFGLQQYHVLRVLDCRAVWGGDPKMLTEKSFAYIPQHLPLQGNSAFQDSELMLGDCLEKLRTVPDNSVDFAFADPPYNLGKNYNSYTDDLSIKEYFAWCDQWISELARVLKPGRTLAILNIPLWAIRHFLHLETVLSFQNWIVWDALSYPVRKIMPAHYATLCFSKGVSRPLPGLTGNAGDVNVTNISPVFDPLELMSEWYCLRSSCVRKRNAPGRTDRGELTDLWWDIHRLKHNSRRVDHPCQLPPQLMYRLISLFTMPSEMVLDCFNGAGTTTLAAHQLGRRYIGVEVSEKYHLIAESRHKEVAIGLDPFRKEDRVLTEKNSPVARMPKRSYEIPKKTLQLEVRRISLQLGRLPTREDIMRYAKYPIRYYDEYFASWGEVCAAARNDGMTETREDSNNGSTADDTSMQLGLFDRGSRDYRR